MAQPSWDLAMAELIFYIAALFALLFAAWIHRKPFTFGWILLVIFVLMQFIGAALDVGTGKNNGVSSTGSILTGVGLSPQLLGMAGVVRQWSIRTLDLDHKTSQIVGIVYHMLVVVGIAMYAIGVTGSTKNPPTDHWESKEHIGVLILFLSWLILLIVLLFLASKVKRQAAQSGSPPPLRALYWAMILSMGFIGVRVLYQTVRAFQNSSAFGNTTSDVVLNGIFEFAMSALMALSMIAGGILTRAGEAADEIVPTNAPGYTSQYPLEPQGYKPRYSETPLENFA